VPPWLRRAAPAAGFCLILLIDGALRATAPPLPVLALLDESAHLLTAALVLATLPRAVVNLWPWVLASAVAIDVDHLPIYLGASWFAVNGGRPPSHSLALVLPLLAGAARPALRKPLLGLAAGVSTHLVRDMATGPGVPLLWPLLQENLLIPYLVYAGLMVISMVGATVRQFQRPLLTAGKRRRPSGRRSRSPGDDRAPYERELPGVAIDRLGATPPVSPSPEGRQQQIHHQIEHAVRSNDADDRTGQLPTPPQHHTQEKSEPQSHG
jgi:inner membrane protein